MVKPALSIAAIAFVALIGAVSTQKGCQDIRQAWTHWDYYTIRDMRHTVVLNPQKISTRAPDPQSVPITGRDMDADYLLNPEHNGADLAAMLGDRMTDAVGTSDSSVARGERKFHKTCIPCHGVSMAGDGPVAALFIPPPDLLAEPTRQRKDGYIFSYIRHGGAVMPSYGAQVTAAEAWDLIHYIRHMQKASPR